MRSAFLFPLLALGGCFRSDAFECTFRDETVSDTEEATNGMSGDDVEAAVIGTTTFSATALEERPEDNPTLAALGPFTVYITESDDIVIMRHYDDDSCGNDPNTSAVVVPVEVRVVSADETFDVSGTLSVYGQDPATFAAPEGEEGLTGTMPSWVTAAADASLQDECTDAGLTGSYSISIALTGEVAAPGLTIEMQVTGDCNSLASLAMVQLEPVP